MSIESETAFQRSVQIVDQYLGTRRSVDALLSRGNERYMLLVAAARDISELQPQEADTLVQLFLKGISTDNSLWNADRRDCAIELLRLVDYSKLNPERLSQQYLGAVATQEFRLDPYGSISHLLQAGKIIAPHLPQNTGPLVSRAWDRVGRGFDGEALDYISKEKQQIIDTIPIGQSQNVKKAPSRPQAIRIQQAEMRKNELYRKVIRYMKEYPGEKLRLGEVGKGIMVSRARISQMYQELRKEYPGLPEVLSKSEIRERWKQRQ